MLLPLRDGTRAGLNSHYFHIIGYNRGAEFNNWLKSIYVVFYFALHALDVATFSRHCLLSVRVNRSYNLCCLLKKMDIDSFVATRMVFAFSGTATLILACENTTGSLLTTGEAVLIGVVQRLYGVVPLIGFSQRVFFFLRSRTCRRGIDMGHKPNCRALCTHHISFIF